MDIRPNIAATSYAQARPATAPQAGTSDGLAGRVAADFAATLQQADATAQAAMTGRADPQALVQALAATELAVETAVALRDKVVEAYQEILRMPV